MKYVLFDNVGFPLSFYTRDIHGDSIPQEAVEITDEQWMEFLRNQGYRRWNGTTIEVIEPPPPPVIPVIKTWTPLQFMEEFTFEERKALRTLAKSDPMAEDWLDLLRASQEVRMDDERTTAGLNYMVLKGVLTQSRVDEILAS